MEQKEQKAENLTTASAGKRGVSVRSDCYIEITPKTEGGITTAIRSKVASLFGRAIKEQLIELAAHFGLEHAHIEIDDAGALPFAISARFEAAYKKLFPNDTKEFLYTGYYIRYTKIKKDHMRRSRLYLPGNEPKYFPNASLHNPDSVILDLEDSVAPEEKAAARLLVRNALCDIEFDKCERMVRINQLPMGLEDLAYAVPYDADTILIPKCESAEQVIEVNARIQELRKNAIHHNEVFIMPIIESAAGILNAYAIASASPNVCALTIGLEDYTADIGAERTAEGRESFFARAAVVNAARAAGVQAIDTVFSDVDDMDGLRRSVLEAKALGFEGKGCIHPRQIPVIHEAFTPTPKEIEKAGKIVDAFREARSKGLGVVSLGSKMIDAPVVKRAEHILEVARKSGIDVDY